MREADSLPLMSLNKMASVSMSDDPYALPHADEYATDRPATVMARLRDRLKAVHPQASEIITAHAALELEVGPGVEAISSSSR
jgi:hypothetical protein